ncbi:unnamed protein product [Rotaria sordida]|uniref:Enoyl reductase (ER) domain-containing protein n=1 Tax=Rotaria sordida TaxID=392033 RepID=A0A813S2H2_9BILA|nr:unnamed protein product [Rotaria sordida]CAF0742522.1 unnamed protein product [Rotaria sordida]CAF0789866.1 unnamed protein product [Rotaria sordida]CAF0791286.1 unnamed protein product [Rotaria sordida]
MIVSRILIRSFKQKYSHICRTLCSAQKSNATTHTEKTYPISGTRTVFNGINSQTMFAPQTALIPELTPGEILVKVRLASICMSDVHTIRGQRIEPTPSVLGHEAIVEVVTHRRPESDLAVGDRLTFSIADSCGQCEFCLTGLNQKCIKLFKYGHAKLSDGSGYNGCYATHIILRRGTHVVKIPEIISDRCAAPINCSLATAMCAMEYVPKAKNGRAFVQGDGMLGLYTCAALREHGFERVYCSGTRLQRSKFIEHFGGIPLYNARRNEILEEETNKIDVVVEVCGVSNVVNDGLRLLKPGGVYLFVGMVHPHSQLNITGEQIIRKCLTIKGIHNYAPRHLDQAVQFLEKTFKKYPYEELIGPTYDLSDLSQAMQISIEKRYGRVLVKPNVLTS